MRFLPEGVVMPEIPSNIMLFIFVGASIMAQWAVYAIRRGDRRHAAMAIALVALFGLGALNLQIAVYRALERRSDLLAVRHAVLRRSPGRSWSPSSSGWSFAVVTAFRSLGGRYAATDTDGVAAFALYWHFLTVAFVAVWLVVYVNK